MEQNTIDFLNSDLDEADFFNLSKDDLIYLRDYLLQLREKDSEFIKLVEKPFNSMKKKCDWITDIAFDGCQDKKTGKFFRSSIWLFPTDGHRLIINCNNEREKYEEIAFKKVPKIYRCLSKNARTYIERQEEAYLLQDELCEIDQIGCSLYNDFLLFQKSVSGHFTTHYAPNIGMNLWGDNDTLATYFVRKMPIYFKPYLDDEGKNKVLSRIQLKNIKKD